MQAQEIKRQLQAFLSDAEIIEADDAFCWISAAVIAAVRIG